MAMLNLQALGETQAIDEARQLRQQLAQASYGRGAVLLGMAGQDSYQDRGLVLAACDLLMDAIQLGRTQVEPYLLLAHVFIVYRDDKQARRYLALAREIEPGHPDIELYSAFLEAGIGDEGEREQEGPRAGQGLVNQTSLANVDDVDPDVLFEQLELEIQRRLREAMSSELAVMQPSAAGLEEQRTQLNQFSAGLTGLQRQLERLAAELDVLDLSRKLRPLEVLQNRLGRVLGQSERMRDLLGRIGELKHQARELSDRAASQAGDDPGPDRLARQSQCLEALLDGCDGLADGIEALEAEQVNISELTAPYEDLCAAVEILQDTLD